MRNDSALMSKSDMGQPSRQWAEYCHCDFALTQVSPLPFDLKGLRAETAIANQNRAAPDRMKVLGWTAPDGIDVPE
jgi:hypothetical protein